jgi:GAF domain-containing protein
MRSTNASLANAAIAPSLDAVVSLAHHVVPSAVAVSVTVVSDAGSDTAAATSAWARALDQAQYAAGAGPCVDAAIGGETRAISDTRRDVRWPAYAAAAVAEGALSSMSVPIPVDDGVVASLNAYATDVDAFGQADHARLRKLAAVAAVVLSTGRQPAIRARDVVDQAKGIVMGEQHCSAALALDVLTARALERGCSLRDAAGDLVHATSR